MRNFFIKSAVLASLTFVFGVAANAQIGAQYRADIPFDFQVNGTSYRTGKYKVGPVSASTSISALALSDMKTGKKKLIGTSTLGGDPSSFVGKLIFSRAGGAYSLVRIVTPTFQMKLRPRPASQVARAGNDERDEVVVYLNN